MSEITIKNVFVDANILLDLHDDTRVSHHDSLTAITSLATSYHVVLFTSCDIITTLYYVISKTDKALALAVIMDISELCEIVEFSNNELIKSCELMQVEKSPYKDLEDTIQYVLADKTDCELILSNDKGFISPAIELLTSKEYASSAHSKKTL